MQRKEKEGSVQFENFLLTYQLKNASVGEGHNYSISIRFQFYFGNSRSLTVLLYGTRKLSVTENPGSSAPNVKPLFQAPRGERGRMRE